jgi:hypothetical protein
MDRQRPEDFTYAGAFDNAFAEYAETLRHVHGVVNPPLMYGNAPDTGNTDMTPDLMSEGPYYGTIGAFHASGQLVAPAGPWGPDYMGILPVSQQPQLPNVEPWENPETQ